MRWSRTITPLIIIGAGLQATAIPVPSDEAASIDVESRQWQGAAVRLAVKGVQKYVIPRVAPLASRIGKYVAPRVGAVASRVTQAARNLIKRPVGRVPKRGIASQAAKKVTSRGPARPVGSRGRPTKTTVNRAGRPAKPRGSKPSRSKPRSTPKGGAGSKKFTAKDFKASSSTYRREAAKSKNPVHRVRNGKLTKSKPDGKVKQGLQADHIVEGQTVARAANAAKRKPSAAAVRKVKKIVNGKKNLSFVDGAINNAKGRATTAALRGRPTTPSANVRAYMKSTRKAGQKAAKRIDKVFKKDGSDARVGRLHRQVLKANRVSKAARVPKAKSSRGRGGGGRSRKRDLSDELNFPELF